MGLGLRQLPRNDEFKTYIFLIDQKHKKIKSGYNESDQYGLDCGQRASWWMSHRII